ncbi:YdcF family protein [Angustibacter luteus]|uniref:YdcF family protein n=1 Tax=Angustibacter luteus TaxID=658456 RepID=A0ABW1JHZ3_9ACTN
MGSGAATASRPSTPPAAPSRRRRSPLRLVLGALVALLAVAVALFVWSAALVVTHGRADDARGADTVVVLGAAQFNGTPGPYLLARLEHALALYQSGTATKVVTVGGKQPGDTYTEGGSGRDWLVRHGVPAGDVVAVEKGRDTLQSVQLAAPVLSAHHWTSAVVVTDRWHELRSTTMLADQGITAYGSPTTTGPSVASPAADAKYVVREAAAYLYYRFHRALS